MNWLNRSFAKAVGINLEESEFPPEHYVSLGDFFVRNLKSGLRPIGEGVVSPVDGRIVLAGPIEEGTMIQAKGKYYRVEELLGETPLSDSFKQGFYITIYLSPKDYHHIHSPVSGRIVGSAYHRGTLWPVNPWSVERIDRLFVVNERVSSFVQTEQGQVAVVKVGATMVGSIRLSYEDIVSNNSFFKNTSGNGTVYRAMEEVRNVDKGDRLGTFHLGSTVILLFEQNRFRAGPRCVPGPIQLGESLGTLQ